MMDQPDHEDDADDGLYLTDAAIIRKLGFGLKKGYRIIHQLDVPNPGRRRYPQPDPLFGNRRFWPAVLQWHLDYHQVRTSEPRDVPTVQPRWQENFDAPTPKTSKTGRAERPRAELATA